MWVGALCAIFLLGLNSYGGGGSREEAMQCDLRRHVYRIQEQKDAEHLSLVEQVERRT